MKLSTLLILLSNLAYAQTSAHFEVEPGKLHRKGKVDVTILPDPNLYKVQMDYNLTKKEFVPVPSKLLKGKTVMEFPTKFKTEAGYKELQQKKSMEIPKARLEFQKREDLGDLKQAYFIKVFPNNGKTAIDLIYHPSLPSVGWADIKIIFISKIPLLNGYKVEAELDR